jgi:hypothetical protein
MTGEKIYECDLDITGVMDFGVSMESILAGREEVPPQGARFDVAFEGNSAGRLSGRLRGVDYLRMRADGRVDLDIRAIIETGDGFRIGLSADGVAVMRPGEPIADLHENVTLTTAAAGFAWVHGRQVWGVGSVNLATGKIHIDAYMQ